MKLADRPPGKLLHYTDMPRAVLEMTALPWFVPGLLSVKKGNGQPVVLIPGFMGDASSLKILRYFLDRLGYRSFSWGQGRNVGFRMPIFRRAVARVEEISRRCGKPVNLIGQSLGGVIAREIAKQKPDTVQQVITLGSPFRDPTGVTSNSTKLYKTLNPDVPPGELTEEELVMMEKFLESPPVPQTAVYSKGDGHTHWTGCLQSGKAVAPAENVAVYGSHIGMGWNGLVLYLIADRLAQDAENWQPFNPGSWRKLYYPKSVAVSP